MKLPRHPVLALAAVLAACSYASGQDPTLRAPPTGFEPDADVDRAALADLPPKPPAPPVTLAPTPEPTQAATPTVEQTDAGAPALASAKRTPNKPAAPTTASPATCDGKATPCPMQRFMRGTMAGAGSDPKKLAAAFARVGSLSPTGAWTWAAISRQGAEAAKADDVTGAKAACRACHDAYKEKYKAQYRARSF